MNTYLSHFDHIDSLLAGTQAYRLQLNSILS
jgi:hypothetical protein